MAFNLFLWKFYSSFPSPLEDLSIDSLVDVDGSKEISTIAKFYQIYNNENKELESLETLFLPLVD